MRFAHISRILLMLNPFLFINISLNKPLMNPFACMLATFRYPRYLPILFAVLLLSASLFAFDYTSYLYPNESVADISTASVTYNSVTYQVVSIRGVNTFVLRGNDKLDDTALVGAILRQSYLSQYYPAQLEFQQLRDTIDAYNDSRNFKTRVGKAEESCRRSTVGLGHADTLCLDQTSCLVVAQMICGLYGAGSCDPSGFVAPFISYSTNLKGLDDNIKGIFFDLDTLTPSNVNSQLNDIQSRLVKVKQYDAGVRQTPLRAPNMGESCPDCIGVCISPTNNASSVNAALSQVQFLIDKTASLAGLDAQVTALLADSEDRIKFKEKQHYTSLYGSRVSELEAKYGNLTKLAADAQNVVSDEALAGIYENYLNIKTTIDAKMKSGKYSLIPQDIDELEDTLYLMNESYANLTVPYGKVSLANKSIYGKDLRAQWQTVGNNSALLSEYANLSRKYSGLSSEFTPPLTNEEYGALEAEYQQLAAGYDAYLQRSSGSLANAPSALSEKLSYPILGAASMLNDRINLGDRETSVRIGLPVLVGVFDLALISVAVLIFLGGLVYFRKRFAKKFVYVVWGLLFAAGIIGAVVLSGGIYWLVGSGADNGTFSSFYAALENSNSTIVRVDTTHLSDPMLACASSIEASLAARNKTVFLVYDSGSSCAVGNETLNGTNCISQLANMPIVSLKYSTRNAASYSNVYIQEATLQGDDTYFSACEFAKVVAT